MTDELQRLVDLLARRLDRVVAVDDVTFRLLAYSAHLGDVDELRTKAILTREAPLEILPWLRGFGLSKATGPIRLPADPESGLQPRIVIPVRCQGVHFGYLWLMDHDNSLSWEDITIATGVADDVGEVLC